MAPYALAHKLLDLQSVYRDRMLVHRFIRAHLTNWRIAHNLKHSFAKSKHDSVPTLMCNFALAS